MQFIAQRSVDPLHDCAFDVEISTDLKLYSLAFSNVWNWVLKNSFPLSVRSHTGRLRIGFVYLGSLNIDSSAAATFFPSLYVKARYAGTLKTRQLPAVDTYNYIFLLRTSKISISQTSILLVVYGFLGKRFLRGLCIMYASCVSSHSFIWVGVFCFLSLVCLPLAGAACLTAWWSLYKLENADGAAGSVYSFRKMTIRYPLAT